MKNKTLSSIFLLGSAFIYASCSSGPRGEIASDANVSDEIIKLDTQISSAQKRGYGVLDSENFSQSKKYLREAKEGLVEDDSQAEIVDDLRISRGYFELAEKNFNERREKLQPVLEARNLALASGIENYPQFADEWESTEDEMKDMSELKSEKITSSDLQKLQTQYMNLELQAIRTQYLSSAEATIKSAMEKDAKKLAPKTLKLAQTDYDTAVNKISANRNSPEFFSSDVIKANYSATKLRYVMSYVQDDKYSETAAVELVHQQEKIGNLGNQVAGQNERLMEQGNQIAFQEAIEIAGKQFTKDEADVYQQGNNLIIRLKAINFGTGLATLPPHAAPLLNKVEAVAEGLDAQKIVVQGHTDSVGAKTMNQKLSMDRAQTVADYLEKNGFDNAEIKTEGYGDTKPLTNNKSADSRAQNRRIDIVITPTSL